MIDRPSNSTVKPRVRMITPVWGADYIDRWLKLCFAALRSDGNIPYLNEHCDFELAIVTKTADAAAMQADPEFNRIMAGIRLRFISLDEFLPATGRTPYGIPLTLAYAKGILDLGPAGIGSYVMLMNADCVVASGSLRGVVARIQQGYDIIASTSIRSNDGNARRAVQSCLDERTGILSVAPREMMKIANASLHSTVSGRIVNSLGPIDSTYYHQIFWRISDDCLAMRGFLLQPLCFRVNRLMEKVICPVDYGFLTEICPGGRFCVLTDSDDYLMLELQERDSESHWLRIAPKEPSLERRLARLATEIASQVGTWTTAEQRRSATKTILYHEGDLPADIANRVAPFDAFVDRILASLPPAVSHIGHFQWLPAVRFYRDDMAKGGSGGVITLLEDPRNRSVAPAGGAAAVPAGFVVNR